MPNNQQKPTAPHLGLFLSEPIFRQSFLSFENWGFSIYKTNIVQQNRWTNIRLFTKGMFQKWLWQVSTVMWIPLCRARKLVLTLDSTIHMHKKFVYNPNFEFFFIDSILKLKHKKVFRTAPPEMQFAFLVCFLTLVNGRMAKRFANLDTRSTQVKIFRSSLPDTVSWQFRLSVNQKQSVPCPERVGVLRS